MVRKKIKPIIVIGGSDPSGGAGIQADLSALTALGVPAFSVITAVTAQDEKRFFSYECVSLKTFRDQLKGVQGQTRGTVVKIGMLGSGRLIPALIAWLKAAKPSFVIVDPVLRSSTGRDLLDEEGRRLLEKKLLPLADLVTPNLREAEILSGRRIQSQTELEEAGTILRRKGCGVVLIKGGHRPGVPIDVLFSAGKTRRFPGKRLRGIDVHGTGCTLASSIAGGLALGKSLVQSIDLGRHQVLKKIRAAAAAPSHSK